MQKLNQPKPEELWFKIANKHRWFQLITGLRCVGDLDKSRFKTGDYSFRGQYFKDYEKVNKTDLEIDFLLNQFKSD